LGPRGETPDLWRQRRERTAVLSSRGGRVPLRLHKGVESRGCTAFETTTCRGEVAGVSREAPAAGRRSRYGTATVRFVCKHTHLPHTLSQPLFQNPRPADPARNMICLSRKAARAPVARQGRTMAVQVRASARQPSGLAQEVVALAACALLVSLIARRPRRSVSLASNVPLRGRDTRGTASSPPCPV
jgi:hypothetical protein